MRKKDWLVALAAALCVTGLVACGGGGSGNDSGGGSTEEEAALEFTECMRAHGVEAKDPKPGQGNIEVGEADDPASRAAIAACEDKLGDGGQELSSGEQEEFKEGALGLAECLREEGIDMGDPKFLGPGKFHLDIEGIDTDSPAFKAAAEACDGKLPDPPGISVGG